MEGNLVERPGHVNGFYNLIPLLSTYDDTYTGSGNFDLNLVGPEVCLHLQTEIFGSSTGELYIEESDGDGVWTRTLTIPLEADMDVFRKHRRTKRYLRVGNPGLEAATASTVALKLYY